MRTTALLLVLLFAALAHAQQDPISADRPGFADGPDVVGARTIQIETGLTVDGDPSGVSIPSLLRIGLTGALELRIESDVARFDDGDGDFAPVSIGVKAHLTDGPIPLSLFAGVQPPSGGGGLRTDDFEGELRLLGDVDLGGGFSLVPNAGIAIAEGGSSGILAASLETSFGNASPFVDFELTVGDGDTSMVLDAGAAWTIGADTQLDVSAGVGVTGDAYADWFVGAGISRRF